MILKAGKTCAVKSIVFERDIITMDREIYNLPELELFYL